ncbi:unnamed protein product [Boreogadus saida]
MHLITLCSSPGPSQGPSHCSTPTAGGASKAAVPHHTGPPNDLFKSKCIPHMAGTGAGLTARALLVEGLGACGLPTSTQH